MFHNNYGSACLSDSGDRQCAPTGNYLIHETDRDGLSEEPGFNSPSQPADFVFEFQGHLL